MCLSHFYLSASLLMCGEESLVFCQYHGDAINGENSGGHGEGKKIGLKG